ncbi:MAG TPA: hypothetical protein VHA52_07190, partial [Candidatus Babeliaceae bacterium]|nr:hypothetical protein [Candidatus Babeliaceae bacterium]
SSPFMIDLPIKVNPDFTPILTNGKLTPNKAVLRRWLRNDPYTLVLRDPVAQNSLRHTCLYIDFGCHEKLIDTTGVKLFIQLLRKLCIRGTYTCCSGTSFDQGERYTPSNDIAESLVQPALQQTTQLLQPDPLLQPKPLVNFVIKATNANPQQFNNTTFANFGGFLDVVCNIPQPPTTGDLLIDPAFRSCLTDNGIDPDQFISDYFTIPGYVSIDPLRFSVDTDGFIGCCSGTCCSGSQPKGCNINCPAQLFLSFCKLHA